MAKTVLITGGAGFIGSHLTDRLLEARYRVRILDNLDPQIHSEGKPAYLNPEAEFIHGDVRDRQTFKAALEGVDAVFHFAAAVGTGQSMYQIAKYSAVNIGGLSNLLDILVETGARPKIIFPGSATSYGECAHACPEHGLQFPSLRPIEQLERKDWEIHCPHCQRVMTPAPIPETQPLCPQFVYGLNKKSCEELLEAVANTYGIPYTILRFFNVYGPRQSLSNPYTGVIAIFSSRIKNGQPPIVIEDGRESRDFVSVYDVVRACVLALEKDEANGQTFNVGTGQGVEILPMAKLLIKLHGATMEPVVNGEFRKNDFRHSQADISKIRRLLGFEPRVDFVDGITELYHWSKDQTATDRFHEAFEELRQRGLLTTSERPKVAVVALNWNTYDLTVECVEALQRSSYPNLKIIIVDNGSANREGGRLKDKFSQTIEVVQNEKNLGVAGGNNAGIRQALKDLDVRYVVIMNNDLLVEPETIGHLVAPAEANQMVGMVAGRMMNYFRRDRIDNLGIAMTTAGLGYNRKSEWYPIFCPCSGLGLYRAEGFRQIMMPDGQVWDDDFFAYSDEQDVGFRLRMAGFAATYAPGAVGYHKDGATSGGPSSDFSIYHGHRNNLWFLVKDFPAGLWWKYLPGIIATQLGTFLLYAKRRRMKVIVRAKWDALRGIPKMLAKRGAVQAVRRVSITDIERPLIRRAYITPER
ncbi:MAG: NAD-dependent epimerase/dehydratase family protein [Candidatus Kerfeldbacteria bacterium]|nr:NAD-dependent epimerase/dehydratase family protein [Candidatus Kerfeldbacteria bacterium]